MTAVLADREADLLPADIARARLVELRDERRLLEERLDRARNERGAGAALLDLASRLLPDAGTVPMREFHASKPEILAAFAALDLDQQRDVVAALLEIELPKGRDPRRAIISHKLAVWLNPPICDR